MRGLALVSLAALAACGSEKVARDPGPLDKFFYPTGIAVLDRRLYVASSNADLTYDETSGGSLIDVNVCDRTADPGCSDTVAGAVNVPSFAGEIGIADPVSCPALAVPVPPIGPSVLVPIRGTDLVERVAIGTTSSGATDGTLTCGDGCQVKVGDKDRGDPWAVGIACDTAATPGGPTLARAYVGYLRSSAGQAWITQFDLLLSPSDPAYVQHQAYGAGQVRGMAYDPTKHRVFFTRVVAGSASSIAYLDLANGCRIDVAEEDGGCRSGASPTGSVPTGLELMGMALAHVTDPASPVRRAYVTARIYDPNASSGAGTPLGDFDGLLLVLDLSEDALGNVHVDVVNQVPIGYGAGSVRVLPARPGKRDVVVALAAADEVLWIYDDDTGASTAIGRSPATGAPLVGQGPAAIAVDPVVLPGNVARVYVGSFREHFVTPVDVPLDDPEAAAIPLDNALPRRITGGVTP